MFTVQIACIHLSYCSYYLGKMYKVCMEDIIIHYIRHQNIEEWNNFKSIHLQYDKNKLVLQDSYM